MLQHVVLVVQVRGSGPWGLPLLWEARAMLDQVQAALAPHWPRLQQLAALPGAVEVPLLRIQGYIESVIYRIYRYKQRSCPCSSWPPCPAQSRRGLCTD